MKRKLLIFLLVLVLLHSAALSVSAYDMPDLNSKGSITFEMVKNGKALNGGRLRLCKVADIKLVDGTYQFVLIDVLDDINVDLMDPTDHDVAEKIMNAAKDRKLSTKTATIVKGKANFKDLETGLYVVWQNKNDVTKGYSPIYPFLISIPRLDGDKYVLDVVAKPKVPLETEPSEPSEPPTTTPPSLPQTGQLNWPIPVMSGVGCLLFAIGLILYGGRKRSVDEK